MKKLIPAIAIAMMAPTLWAVKGTISSESDSKSGDITYQPRAKNYIVSYKRGQTAVTAEFPLASVTELNIPKPANYDKLVAQVEAGEGAKAIEGLKAIVSEYRMLVWDKPAARYLTDAYLAGRRAKDALDTAQKVVDEDKSAAYTGDLAPAYWRALLANGKADRLENCLNKAVSSGDRAASAEALVVRGDQVLATGDSPDIVKKALTDNYLRVALMYTDAPCKSARKTALQKAAGCLDKLGMASRAETLRGQAANL